VHPLKKVDLSIQGSVGEGIILGFFRACNHLAYHAGETELGTPDIKDVDKEGIERFFEVKYKEKGAPWEGDFMMPERQRYHDLRASVIWINSIQPPYIQVAHFPWEFARRRIITIPLMSCPNMQKWFNLNEVVYIYCEAQVALLGKIGNTSHS